MTHPERSPERDAALDALVAALPFGGWNLAALVQAAGPDADLLFPGGPVDMVETYCDLTDRRMAAEPFPQERLSERVRAALAKRFELGRDHKDAIRRGLAVLAAHPAAAARCTARSVDAIWHAAGDRSADFSWYTKRAILAGVYTSTLLFWLRDYSEDDAATLAFLDRRLSRVGELGRLRRKVACLRPRRAA